MRRARDHVYTSAIVDIHQLMWESPSVRRVIKMVELFKHNSLRRHASKVSARIIPRLLKRLTAARRQQGGKRCVNSSALTR
jgi:hypothetical protein